MDNKTISGRTREIKGKPVHGEMGFQSCIFRKTDLIFFFPSLKQHIIIISQFLWFRRPGVGSWILCAKSHDKRNWATPGLHSHLMLRGPLAGSHGVAGFSSLRWRMGEPLSLGPFSAPREDPNSLSYGLSTLTSIHRESPLCWIALSLGIILQEGLT